MNVMAVNLKLQKWAKAFFCAFLIYLAMYLAVYLLLTLNGAYIPVASGRIRLNFGWAILDTYEWEPKGLVWFDHLNMVNTGGLFYEYLIKLDRAYWHTNIDMYPPDYWTKPENR